jgi:hypothetical protein
MNIILIGLIILAYIFAGIGYYITCKDRIRNMILKKWEKIFIVFIIITGVGLWLPMLGFAYIMSEIEMYLKKL